MDSIVPVGSTRVAEMVKLLENTFRSVNIGLVNELALMCDRMGIDVWEVIDAAKTKPFGFMPFYPGPGLGGHCIPIDPFYLSWKARESGFEARFIELAGSVNSGCRITSRSASSRRSTPSASRFRLKVLVVGWPTRRTSTTSANHLARHHGDPRARRRAHLLRRPLRAGGPAQRPCFAARAHAGLDPFRCVVIATAHKNVDYGMIAKHARTIVDSRNALRGRRTRGVFKL